MFGIPPRTQDRFSMGWTLMCICVWPKASHPGLYWPSERKGYHHTVDTRNQNPAADNEKHIPFLYHGEKRKTWYIIKHTYNIQVTGGARILPTNTSFFWGGSPLKKMGEDPPHIGAWWLRPATRLRRSLRSACGSKQSKTWSCGNRGSRWRASGVLQGLGAKTPWVIITIFCRDIWYIYICVCVNLYKCI